MGKRTPLKTMLILTMLLLSACAPSAKPAAGNIQVVATTSILADIVSQVGGDLVSVDSLVPAGVNEHEYQPSPRDIAAVSDAALVFQVGLGLEQFMETIINNAAGEVNIITVSEGITAMELEGGQEHEEETGDGQHEHTTDPHVWLDPSNVMVWTENITNALSAIDPANSGVYKENSEAYIAELKALDAWIIEETARVPQDARMIVTDHMLFGYFAAKYNFTVVGAIIPSYSSLAEPSAQELASLEDSIRHYNVRVILVGNTVNPALASRIAKDTGIELIQFYTGSLSAPDGPASTYLNYMRYNVSTIVNALTGE